MPSSSPFQRISFTCYPSHLLIAVSNDHAFVFDLTLRNQEESSDGNEVKGGLLASKKIHNGFVRQMVVHWTRRLANGSKTEKEKSDEDNTKMEVDGDDDERKLKESGDGKERNVTSLLITSGEDKMLRVWKLPTLELISERPLQKRANSLTITPSTYSNHTSDSKRKEETIIVADKFGDVYSFPLLSTSTSEQPLSSSSLSNPSNPSDPSTSSNDPNSHLLGNPKANPSNPSSGVKTRLPPERPPVLGSVSMLTYVIYGYDHDTCDDDNLDKDDGIGKGKGKNKELTVKDQVREGSGRRKGFVVTAERDEHVRISEWPEGWKIRGWIRGHRKFVSSLLLIPPPSSSFGSSEFTKKQDQLLLSAGGDPYLLISSPRTCEVVNVIGLEYMIGFSKVIGKKKKSKEKGKGKGKKVNMEEEDGAEAGEEAKDGEGKGKRARRRRKKKEEIMMRSQIQDNNDQDHVMKDSNEDGLQAQEEEASDGEGDENEDDDEGFDEEQLPELTIENMVWIEDGGDGDGGGVILTSTGSSALYYLPYQLLLPPPTPLSSTTTATVSPLSQPKSSLLDLHHPILDLTILPIPITSTSISQPSGSPSSSSSKGKEIMIVSLDTKFETRDVDGFPLVKRKEEDGKSRGMELVVVELVDGELRKISNLNSDALNPAYKIITNALNQISREYHMSQSNPTTKTSRPNLSTLYSPLIAFSKQGLYASKLNDAGGGDEKGQSKTKKGNRNRNNKDGNGDGGEGKDKDEENRSGNRDGKRERGRKEDRERVAGSSGGGAKGLKRKREAMDGGEQEKNELVGDQSLAGLDSSKQTG